jgi:hypothetical protein
MGFRRYALYGLTLSFPNLMLSGVEAQASLLLALRAQ